LPQRHKKSQIFPLGGPGYTLNRAAVDLFGREGLDSFLNSSRDWREDVFMGSFFNGKGVYLTHTLDRKGGRRYETSADQAAKYRRPVVTNHGRPDFFSKFGVEPGELLDSVSEEMAAFHLRNEKQEGGILQRQNKTVEDLMHRYHAILYDLCPKDKNNNNAE
jgi:hypothetical protein